MTRSPMRRRRDARRESAGRGGAGRRERGSERSAAGARGHAAARQACAIGAEVVARRAAATAPSRACYDPRRCIDASAKTAEHQRLEEARAGKKWRRWGTYLSERQWGTVREDYSRRRRRLGLLPARARARRAPTAGARTACSASATTAASSTSRVALWNGEDPILKERLFGLTGPGGQPRRGRQGALLVPRRDADALVRARALQVPAAPRSRTSELARAGARRRPRRDREPELLDTGVFDDDRYFDVRVEYAKDDVDDVLVRITVTNRGPERGAARRRCRTLWFRNTWSWDDRRRRRAASCVALEPLGDVHVVETRAGAPRATSGSTSRARSELLFTENETNAQRLWRRRPTARPT